MRIGLTFNAKSMMADELRRRGLPVTDDALEEYDADETVRELAETLRSCFGAEVHLLGWGAQLVDDVRRVAPDVVFNIAEGYGGRSREAQVPALLEMLGVPFVGSDALALAVSLDKQATKAMVSSAGVTVPRGMVVRERCDIARLRRASDLELPLVVKPVHEGSSRGIKSDSLCTNDVELTKKVLSIVEEYGEPAMVEEYVDGREITVGLVGDPVEVLGVMEIGPKDPTHPWKIYSLDIKRRFEELALYTCPARLATPVRAELVRAALTAFHALGCKDMARVDFRLRPDGTPVFLEINPLPGLRRHVSDLDLMAIEQSIPYEDIIRKIATGAFRRLGLSEPSPRIVPARRVTHSELEPSPSER